jgi:hypothetical protein
VQRIKRPLLVVISLFVLSGFPSPAHADSGPDLALRHRVTASSTDQGSDPAAAVDGDTSTAWFTSSGGPQWIYVNLGATYDISDVVLNWDTAYATSYAVQVSSDAVDWTTIYSTEAGDGGVDDITGLSAHGRYVRIYATSSAATGYALFELSAYGTASVSGPSNLRGRAWDGAVSLSWDPPSDTTGISGYRVFRDGTLVGKTTDTSFIDQGLTDGTTYRYTVRAYDAALDVSPLSNRVDIAPVSVDLSGAVMPLGDLAGWHQVFADDLATDEPIGSFSGCVNGTGVMGDYCEGLRGSPYFGVWYAYPDGWTGSDGGTYYPSQTISVAHGALDYYLHSASVDGTTYHMIDAAMPKVPDGVNGGGLLYGRYAVRARWDALSSYHISFLLWPDSDNWPHDGEIDFPEANMGSTDISAFMHWQNATSGSQQDVYDTNVDPTQWHTYEIEWLPNSLSFYVDGTLIGHSTTNVPDTPMHWVLQTNASSEMTSADTEAGHLQIDWAVAYTPS